MYKPKFGEIVRVRHMGRVVMRVSNRCDFDGKIYGVRSNGHRMSDDVSQIEPATENEKNRYIKEERKRFKSNPSNYDRNLNELLNKIGYWAEQTFTKSTNESIISHMKEEINEISNANSKDLPEEVADLFLLISHLCYKNNIDLAVEASKKLYINFDRKWETEAGDKGYFKHVK